MNKLIHTIVNIPQSRKSLIILGSIYLIYLLILCNYMFPCVDSFYYWEWSQHLQLSYFDGPPMIAYTIRALTSIFGNSVFALNLLGVLYIYISGFLVYKIANKLEHGIGLIALCLWIFYPFVTTRYILLNVTYDGLECIWVLAIIYTVMLYLESRAPRWIYLIGILSGLLLLSKYSGIILLIGLILFFIINSKERHIFKSIHIYIAMLICSLIFSQVIIWNSLNHWTSFHYQLTTHLWNHDNLGHRSHVVLPDKFGLTGVIFYLWNAFFGTLHILILFMLYVLFVKKPTLRSLPPKLKLLIHFFIVYFIFWLSISWIAHVSMSYMICPSAILIILVSYYLKQYNLQKALGFIAIIFLIINFIMVFNTTNHNKVLNQVCYITPTSPTGNCYTSFIKNNRLKYYYYQ